ncbi:hypothetical protein [Stenotrophomonas maltophilia]|uniref:hypothetical protein n=1 Tax=Stenotrophomonas maltophilia TaxID=40324 RepID=UPI002B1E61F9|nr:hypothetical protein [Stenotrophomonas maltophilia]
MTPFDMIAATWRNRSTRILTPLLAVALLPIIALFVLFHIGVCIGYGVLMACVSFAWNVGEFNRDRRHLGLTFGQAIADRLRWYRADLAAYAHSSWRSVREFVGKRWRRAVFWTVFGPMALVLAVIPALVGAFVDWLGNKHDALLRFLDRVAFADFMAWSKR